jgi:hypothetical protein
MNIKRKVPKHHARVAAAVLTALFRAKKEKAAVLQLLQSTRARIANAIIDNDGKQTPGTLST